MFTEKKYLIGLQIQILGLLGVVAFLVTGLSRTLSEGMYFILLFAVPVAMFIVGKNAYTVLNFDPESAEFLAKKVKYEKENMKTYLTIKKLKERGEYYPRSIYYTRVAFVSTIYVALLFSPVAPIALILFIYYLKKVSNGSNYYKIWEAKMKSKKIKAKKEKQALAQEEKNSNIKAGLPVKKESEELAEKSNNFYDEDLELFSIIDEDLAKLGSYENPDNQEDDGYKWSNSKEIFLAGKNKPIYIDNFNFGKETFKKIDPDNMSEDDIAVIQDVKFNITNYEGCHTILVLGSMGGGKTQGMFNIVSQNRFQRCFIHDFKGDFTQKYYDESRGDIIMNFYDKRSSYWALFEEAKENAIVSMTFLKNLIKASIGDDKDDFFSSQATKIVLDIFGEISLENDLTELEKWEKMLLKIEQYISSTTNNTTSSIAMTMELSIEIIRLNVYIIQKGAKPFTLKKFFEAENGQTIFLLNNPIYKSTLNPYFGGFVSAFTQTLLGRPDNETEEERDKNVTLTVLDEFYELGMPFEASSSLLTNGRSKGNFLVLSCQFIYDDKLKPVLMSSRFITMIFGTQEEATVKGIIDGLGEVKYKGINSQSQYRYGQGGGESSGVGGLLSLGNSSHQRTHQVVDKVKSFLTPKRIKSVPSHKHITIVPSRELVYLGYTKMPDPKSFKNSQFDQIDMADYGRFKYGKKFKEDPKEIQFQQREQSLSEENRFIHWINLKFPESEIDFENYAHKHGIDSVQVSSLFAEFDENTEKLKEAIAQYTNEERLQMMDEFFSLKTEKEKYHFSKKKNIIGAIIGLFMLDADFIIEKMEELSLLEGV